MYWPNLKSVAFPIPGKIRGTQKIWAVPGYAHAPFSLKFLMDFCSDGLSECTGQISIPEIIAIGFLGGVRTPILGKGRPYGVGDAAVGKSVGKFL